MFPEFKHLSDSEIADVWSTCIFVFDTNVLLNLYRYRADARKQMLEILAKFGARVWIPHHVALEFHRNRLGVIASQSKGFDDVRAAVRTAEKSLTTSIEQLNLDKRHSSIDAAPLLKGIGEVVSAFVTQLSALEESKQTLTGADPILEALEEIFEARVGPPPDNQKALDELYAEADDRFKRDMPPGLRDLPKEEIGSYCSGGLVYKPVYGDVVVWHQILAHAARMKLKHLILVTDDAKDDWWRVVKAPAPQTVGPRPEIVEEAILRGSLDRFMMYRTERFLRYAKEHLDADVSAATLREAKEVARQSKKATRHRTNSVANVKTEEALYRYLLNRFELVENGPDGSELIAYRNQREHIFRIVRTLDADNEREFLDSAISALRRCESPAVARVYIVMIVDGLEEARKVMKAVPRITIQSEFKDHAKARVIVGSINPAAGTFVRLMDRLLAHDVTSWLGMKYESPLHDVEKLQLSVE